MKIKLKVLHLEDTPANATRRIVLEHDDSEYHEWIREDCDNVFLLWSNCRGRRGDTLWNPVLKTHVEVDSPYEPVLDDEGDETGDYRLKDGLIAFRVDVYEHSGMAWALHREGGPGFTCPWDSTSRMDDPGPFVLYTDEERWNSLCGNCKWEFVDGEPTDELYEAARKVARSEVEMMNLCELDSYYGYRLEAKIHERADVVTTDADGEVSRAIREFDDWDEEDSCWGCLTDKPARDCDFPVGIPVVSENTFIVGDEYEQECWALRTPDGLYMTSKDKFVDDPKRAFLTYRRFLDDNRAVYERETGVKLEVVDVTEEVWSAYPECIVGREPA